MNILRTLFHLFSLVYVRLTELNIFFRVKSLENVIQALVFSRLLYCSPIWSSTSKKNVSKLQSVQNIAVRVVTDSRKFEHITPVLRDVNWLALSRGLAPRYLCSRFVNRATVHARNTRNKNKLDIPEYKSAAGQRSFLYRSLTLWNSLPTAITDCNSLEMFKRKLKQYLFQFYFANS